MGGYTEDRLRKFVLLHYWQRLSNGRLVPRLRRTWTPIGIGIPVPARADASGGSIDILFMSDQSEFLIAEVKRRENSERGKQPIEQALRYWRGLQAIRSFEKDFLPALKRRWRQRRAHCWIKARDGQRLSVRFRKAMEQLLGEDWRARVRNGFEGLRKSPVRLLIVQNESLHRNTFRAIRQARQQGLGVWGLEVSFPHHQAEPWSLR